MESDNLYRVQEEDLPRLQKLLTVCFAQDPLYHTLIPDDDTRERLLPELFSCDLTEARAALTTDGWLIKEDPSLKTFWNFIQGKDYLNSSWTDQLHQTERLHVIYLAVDPGHQHHGLAELLMDEVINYAQKHKMLISLETHNPNNVPIYEHFGFKTYGIVEKHHFGLKQYCMIREATV